MPAQSAIRVDILKAAIYDAVTAYMGSAVAFIWGDQGVPRPSRPYIAARILSGPRRPGGATLDIRQMRSAPTSVSVTLGSVTSTTRYRIRINGAPFDVTAGGADTVDTIRTAHVAAINASSEPVTGSAGGSGEAILAPDFAGAIVETDATPAADYTITPSGEAFVIDHVSPRRVVVSFDVIVGEGIAELGSLDVGAYALDLAAQLEAGFELESTRQLLQNRRIPCFGPVSDPINLTGVATTLNEGRVTIDIEFGIAAVRTEATSVIEQVEITTDISGLGFTETIDTTP
jgi:hypothetical protein